MLLQPRLFTTSQVEDEVPQLTPEKMMLYGQQMCLKKLQPTNDQ